jgi:hypothetical protein
MTMFRVKKGPCAPLKLSSMPSWPATGMTCIRVTTGVEEDWDMGEMAVDLKDIVQHKPASGDAC